VGDGADRLRVAFVVDSLVVGGAERVVEALANGLGHEGFEVVVGCLRSPGPIGEALRTRGIRVDEGLATRRADPLQIPAVIRWLRGVGADVVLVLDHSNALFFGRVAARFAGLPAVAAVHRTRRADGSPSLGRIDRLLEPWTAALIAVSRGHADYLARDEGVDPSRLRVVHNGVDVDRFAAAAEPASRGPARTGLGIPSGALVFAIVAALRPEKNHESLLRAMAAPELEAARLAVVGDGERRDGLQTLATELGVGSRVHWLGWRDDVERVLAAVDVLVLPSHPNVETFPMCVLEAMAAARPVVATRVGSLEEMVDDGRTGWLVPPGDPGALTEALAEAASDPEERRRRGEAGRARVTQDFTEEQMVAGVAAVLREAVRG
jgi:glycosyltransferase involved in cell wall biosynthesis